MSDDDVQLLYPFALAAQELYTRHEVHPDDHRIVQIGRVWLTWGDFRKVRNLYERQTEER